MLNLKTTDSLELITSAATTVDCVVSWVDDVADVFTPDTTVTAPTTATTTPICAAPSTGVRNVKNISIRNTHASTTNDVTVQVDRSATNYTIIKASLLAGEALIMRDGVWFHYDANGGVYGQALPIASQSDMEAATSVVTIVTPGRQHFHPSAAKFWVIFTGNSTTITASYNMTSITDGTTQATVTIATDFSGSAWCIQATAVAAAATAAGARLASCLTMAAGSIIVFCTDASATPALADPTSWCVAGFGDQ
jgi:hypothetical protein